MKYNGKLVVISGATASGKSGIALKLAKKINGVIINADSRQIYKEISIGTAKPSEIDMENIPHYLYGHVSVKEKYNVYRYQKDIGKVLEDIPESKTPILVGGTGLYIDCIVYNYSLQESDKEWINEREKLSKLNIEELRKMVDKDILSEINESDINNPVRLIRIIEKGNTIHRKGKPLNHKYFVLDIPKKIIHNNIERRVNDMFKKGLLEENVNKRELGLEKYPSLNTIGYKEFDKYFNSEITIEDVKKEIISNTKKYAKRQITWFKRNKDAIWANDYSYIEEEVLKFINT